MKIQDFLALSWSEPGEPLIEPPRLSPVVADPSFLLPEETPSGEWELFAHSAWGIHRFSSDDGRTWADRGLVIWHAMRPFVRRLESPQGLGSFHLLYESYEPFALVRTALPGKRPWNSAVARSRSEDLRHWDAREVLLGPSLPWMADPALGSSVSNPCLVESGRGEWRLYCSASLAFIDDCGFNEPRFIALASGSSPEGPFRPRETPIIDPAEDLRPGVLGAGSIKVIRLEDGYVGLQNKIYRDPRGLSRSAIFLLRSEDGLDWKEARDEPLLAPGEGWTSSHVYACDCRFRESEGLWYLYFNARDGWRISEGKERIGRIVGRA